MEYVTGGDLATKLKRARGSLSVPEIRRLALELAEALALAHDNSLVHGALSPGKVLYSIDGKVKVTGFVCGPGSPWFAMEGAGEPAFGESSEYRDPSATKGKIPGVADDVYAFGAILFHATAGKPPELKQVFQGEGGKGEFVEAVRRAGPGLSGVILRCLTPSPEPPFYSFHEVLAGLQSA